MNSTSSIITIGREYGSGGRQIGQEVAKYFGIKCYDKELLEHAANESGICKELFENHDEKPTNSFLYSLVMDTYSFGYSSSGFTDMPMNHKEIGLRRSMRYGRKMCRLCIGRIQRLLQCFCTCRYRLANQPSFSETQQNGKRSKRYDQQDR